MKIALVAALIVLALIGFLLLRRRRSESPAGWTMVTFGNDYGTKAEPDGSFNFPIGDPTEVVKLPLDERPGAHYLTQPCTSLASHLGMRLIYGAEIAPGVELHPSSDPTFATIGPTLYFQREGDDESGKGVFDGYRWYATSKSPSPIVAGNNLVVEALFSDRWTGVEHFNSVDNEAAFISALTHACRMGFVFGGGTGYGHGVFATGKARFILRKFELI